VEFTAGVDVFGEDKNSYPCRASNRWSLCSYRELSPIVRCHSTCSSLYQLSDGYLILVTVIPSLQIYVIGRFYFNCAQHERCANRKNFRSKGRGDLEDLNVDRRKLLNSVLKWQVSNVCACLTTSASGIFLKGRLLFTKPEHCFIVWGSTEYCSKLCAVMLVSITVRS
jgi:hypothetical protein